MLRTSERADMTPRPHPCKHQGDKLTLGEATQAAPVYFCNKLKEICTTDVKVKQTTCCRECPHYSNHTGDTR